MTIMTGEITSTLLTGAISLASILAVVYVFLFDRLQEWDQIGEKTDTHECLLMSVVAFVCISVTVGVISLIAMIYNSSIQATGTPSFYYILIVLSASFIFLVLIGLASVITLHSIKEVR